MKPENFFGSQVVSFSNIKGVIGIHYLSPSGKLHRQVTHLKRGTAGLFYFIQQQRDSVSANHGGPGFGQFGIDGAFRKLKVKKPDCPGFFAEDHNPTHEPRAIVLMTSPFREEITQSPTPT